MNLRIRMDPVTLVLLVLVAGCLVALGLEGVRRVHPAGTGPRPAATAPAAGSADEPAPAPPAPAPDRRGGVG